MATVGGSALGVNITAPASVNACWPSPWSFVVASGQETRIASFAPSWTACTVIVGIRSCRHQSGITGTSFGGTPAQRAAAGSGSPTAGTRAAVRLRCRRSTSAPAGMSVRT